MKHARMTLLVIAIALPGCTADGLDEDLQRSDNTPICSNNTDEPCGCYIDVGCPDGMICVVTDATPPPFDGVCLPDPGCNDNTDPNCTPPPPDGCDNNTDPDCDNTPPDGCDSNTDPNCTPPPDDCNTPDCSNA